MILSNFLLICVLLFRSLLGRRQQKPRVVDGWFCVEEEPSEEVPGKHLSIARAGDGEGERERLAGCLREEPRDRQEEDQQIRGGVPAANKEDIGDVEGNDRAANLLQ